MAKRSAKSSPKKKASKGKRTKRAKGAAKQSTARPASRPSSKAVKPRKKAGASAKSEKATAARRAAPRSRRRGGLGISGQHVDFLTYKVDQVRKFYEETLELKSESRDADGLNYLVVATSEESSLGFMPPHPEMRGEQPLPREPTIYFEVRDIDAAFEKLTARGVAFMGPPQEMPWGHRVVTTTDPEGRTVMLASRAKRR